MVIDPGGIFDGRCHMLASSESSYNDHSHPRGEQRLIFFALGPF